MICFLAHLSLFNIQDVPTSVTKGRHALVLYVSDYASKGRCPLVLRIFDYASKGRHALLGARRLLETKAGTSHIMYKERRMLE
jgi:hypothetical protein